MRELIQDLHFSIRLMRKNVLATLIAVFSIGLGIGINATVFSWADATLLRPVPGIDRAGDVVLLKSLTPEGDPIDSSYPDYRDFRDQSTLFAGLVAVKERPLALMDGNQSERVWAEMVTGNYFDVFGVKPILGRTFNREEQGEQKDAYPVTVISERFWERRFARDPRIIGRTVRLNQHEFTVIGVVPGLFRGAMTGVNFDLWVPLMTQRKLTGSGDWLSERRARPIDLFARLRPGATIEQAQAEVSAIASRLAQEYPSSNGRIGARLYTLSQAPEGPQTVLSILVKVLAGAGFVVLLIVCSNVANLTLVRAAQRRKEFAIRLGVGCAKGRLVRQLLTESLIIAAAGTVVGLLMVIWLSDALALFIPTNPFPIGLALRFDGWIVLYAVGLSVLATLLSGIAPALQAAAVDVNETLKQGGRGLSSGSGAGRLRRSLVVAEVALAVVALAGAGLLVKSYENARAAKPNFDPDPVLLAGLDLSTSGYTREQGLDIIHRVVERTGALPGVRTVSLAEDVPLGVGGRSWEDLEVEGYVPRTGENMKVWRNIVTPGYFDTVSLPLVQGRDFTWQDTRQTERVMIVNETFVRRFLPSGIVLGRKVKAFGRPFTIVGVAKDSKYLSLSENPIPYFYVPVDQIYNASMGLAVHVRVAGDPGNFASAVRRELQSVDPGATVFVVAPMAELLSAAYFAQKVGASLLAVLAAIAVLLAALGLYGVMAYSVTQRTQEIGIRMALGATPASVFLQTFRESLALTVAGVAGGTLLAFVLARLASDILYGVSAADAATYLAAGSFLILISILASWLPAARATRLDPIRALQHE
ncbi:MAG: ABC transporter permease [Bryobacteraceae bacterium]|nr:ABC transporter permease [Bryobacteraceae bacterium]